MIYITYILKSKFFDKIYIGHTKDERRRLKEHNSGKGTYSKRYKPWNMFYKENYNSHKEAIRREKYLKSAAGRRWIKKNLFD